VWASTCKIVLVRPRNPNNIGAVARAMKNFGLTDLWVVSPHPPVWNEVVSAVHATDVLTNARVVHSLIEAIADCNLVIGTTARTRVEQKQAVYTPADLSRELSQFDYHLALVFGSEKHGLTNEDFSHCHRVMSIPTQPDCPSMNLGQAVAVCCYELARELKRDLNVPRPTEATSAASIEVALQLSLDVLRLVDFVSPRNEPGLTRKWRSKLLRLNLAEYDVGILCSVLSRIKRELEDK
jgi:TrmH family RNA methyltransferase